MLNIIRNLLAKIVDDIDSNNTNIDYKDLCKILQILVNIKEGPIEMSKLSGADHIGVSKSTFENYVRDGILPKGREIPGFKEKRWYKSDLDLYNINNDK